MYSLHDDLTAEKKRSEELAKLFRQSPLLRDSGIAIGDCSSTVSFTADGDGVPRLFKVFRCRQKYCPTCQRRKSLRAYAEGMRLAAALQDRFAFLHVVLTVRNCDGAELRHTVQKMNRASSALFRGQLCKTAFKGVLRCLEVSVNRDTETFHPHFHCLVAVNKSYFTSRTYVRQDQLAAAWAELIGQPEAVVYVSRVRDPGAAIAEVCKYCTKPFELQGKLALQFYEVLYQQTKHLRHIQAFGVVREALRALKIDFEEGKDAWEGEDLDLSGFEDLDAIFGGGEHIYRWNEERGKYIVESRLR